MRLNIASKLFLGFCAVILLNVFYVFIVNQLTDMNSIANILKIQEEIKNRLLKIEKSQNNRYRNKGYFGHFFENATEKNEIVIQRFMKADSEFNMQLRVVRQQLQTISQLSSEVFKGELNNSPYYETSRRLNVLMADVERNGKLYTGSFDELIKKTAGPSKGAKSKKAADKALKFASDEDPIHDKINQSLRDISALLDEQTKTIIKKIENRIDEVKRQTIVILSGIVIVAIGFALFFSGLITNSMRRLKESAAVIGKGNFDFDSSGYPNDEIGDLAAAFFVMATDLKTAQDELVKSRRLAAIGEIVASVNHEINNPLMIISGNAQFLEMSMTDFPAEMKERVRIILDETDRISRVTKKLREIKNPVVEDYTSSGEQMINLEKSTSG